jgi:hypothetical protein
MPTDRPGRSAAYAIRAQSQLRFEYADHHVPRDRLSNRLRRELSLLHDVDHPAGLVRTMRTPDFHVTRRSAAVLTVALAACSDAPPSEAPTEAQAEALSSDTQVFVGDFNGDGKADGIRWRDADKTWVVSLSTGSTFTTQTWTGACGWSNRS